MKKFIHSIIGIFLIFIIWPLGQNMAFAEENWVEVEQSPLIIEKDGKTKRIKFLDYKDRRQVWNFRFTFLGSQVELSDYTFSSTETLSSLKSDGVSFEGLISLSYNIGIFSAGLDFGLMSASFDRDVSVVQPKASVHIIADALFRNPYAVPYFKFGASQMTFNNSSSSDLPEIKSNLATFFAIGGMFSLDWFQKQLAMDAYFGYGLDTTYLVIEYESFTGIPLEASVLPNVRQSAIKVGLQLVF